MQRLTHNMGGTTQWAKALDYIKTKRQTEHWHLTLFPDYLLHMSATMPSPMMHYVPKLQAKIQYFLS